MKRVSHTVVYSDATLHDVFAMLGDPAYRRAVADHQRVVDFDCRISMDGEGMDVRLEQAHSTDRIPGFAQKLVGPEIRFVQQETWASPSSADIHLAIPGKPGDVTGVRTSPSPATTSCNASISRSRSPCPSSAARSRT
jgi:hypothetical protein